MNWHLLQLFRHIMPVSICDKILLFFGLSIVMLFTLMGAVNYFGVPFGLYEGEYRKGKAAAIQRLTITADDKKKDIEQWLDHCLVGMKICADDPLRMASVRTLAASFHSGSGLPKPDTRLEEWLSSVKDAFQYDAIEIVDSVSGTKLFSTEQDGTGSKCPVLGELFAGGTDWTDKIFMGKGGNDDKGFLYIARMVKGGDNGRSSDSPSVVLLLRSSMGNPYLMEILHDSELLGETGEIVLVDMQKRLLAPLKHKLPDGTVARLFDYRLSTRAAEYAAWGIDGTIESKDYRGLPVIAVVRHHRVTPDFGLCIIVKQDEREILAQLKNGLYTTIVITSSGLIALLGILYLLTKALLKPLETLSSVVHRIESGDLGARARIETKDEVGVLANAFNRMVEKIQVWHEEFESQVHSQTEEIRALNTDLEQRVEHRTAQLEAANRELEAFSYSVSHDLRAPLRHINGFARILVEDYDDCLDEAGRDSLDRICAASSKMGKLIDELLRFSRVSRAEISCSNLDLTELAGNVAAMFRELEPEPRVNVKIAKGLRVWGDATLLDIVLQNLIGNAWKYTSHTKEALIEVGRCTVDGGEAFFVKDNGVGFNMEYSGKLFKVFERLHGDEIEGTGIGLATVHRIITRHGGVIWAKAEEGIGATFYFTLPQAA